MFRCGDYVKIISSEDSGSFHGFDLGEVVLILEVHQPTTFQHVESFFKARSIDRSTEWMVFDNEVEFVEVEIM